MANFRSFAVTASLVVALCPLMLFAQAAAGYGTITAKSAGTASGTQSLASGTSSAVNQAGVALASTNSANRPAQSSSRPKIIEIPVAGANGSASGSTTAELVPAVFVLKDGQRIEAPRFTIAQGFVHLRQAGTGARRIPLRDLDLPATLSANRERGIDLKIPSASNQVTLRF